MRNTSGLNNGGVTPPTNELFGDLPVFAEPVGVSAPGAHAIRAAWQARLLLIGSLLAAALVLAAWMLSSTATTELAGDRATVTAGNVTTGNVTTGNVTAAAQPVAQPVLQPVAQEDSDEDAAEGDAADGEDAGDGEGDDGESEEDDEGDKLEIEVEYPGKDSDFDLEIVTAIFVDKGDEISNGDVLLEVSTRPMFVFEGDLPAVRTLAMGVEGPDVAQLESALAALGFHPGTVDELFDAQTAAAVAAFYADRGYEPPDADEGDVEDLLKAELDVTELEVKREILQVKLAAAGEPDFDDTRGDLVDLQKAEADVAIILARIDALEIERAPLADLDRRFGFVLTALRGGYASGNLGPADPDDVPADLAAEFERLTNNSLTSFRTIEDALDELVDDYNDDVVADLADVEGDLAEERIKLEVARSEIDLAWNEIWEISGADDVAEARLDIEENEAKLHVARELRNRLASRVAVRMSIDEFVFIPTLPAEVDKVEAEERAEAKGALVVIETRG